MDAERAKTATYSAAEDRSMVVFQYAVALVAAAFAILLPILA